MKTLFWKEFRENRLLLFLSFGLIMAVFILQMIFLLNSESAILLAGECFPSLLEEI